ncbi:MAG: flagellar filament capping protein FliD [Marinobacter sp.]|nr:flagellar filament capping protein FliD [Marinobacter sp.]
MASISSLGIGSGVLTSDLVEQLVAAERGPKEQRLDFRTEQTDAKLSAYGQLRSAVTELRLPMRQLGSADAMRSFSAESSGGNVSASVDSSIASRGSYNINVSQMAQANALAFQSMADRDSTSVGSGTLTLAVGDKTTNITIDDSNDTLQGVANSINDADAGVSASIINTGNGYRLVLSSDETGSANAINMSTDAAGGSALSNFVVGAEETTPAQDAMFTINGIEVTKGTNTVDDVVDGVTFDITGEGVSTVKIEQDTGAIAERVQEFVDKFNALQGTVRELTSFNSETGQASILTGDSTVRNIQNQLKRVLSDIVPGLEDANVRSLADVGISTNFETGELQFNSQRFQQQLAENPDDVTALFAEQGRATDPQVEFVRSGSNTQPGDYDINVSQMATRGALNYDLSGVAGDIAVGADSSFTFKVDGQTDATISVAEGTYTKEAFAAALQEQLSNNAALNASGRSVQVDFDGAGNLSFTSNRFGNESNVSLTAVTGVGELTTKTGDAGLDVQGTINGQAAQGDGQVLFLGNSDGGDAAGLQVRITGGDLGDRGSVNFIEGISERSVDTITSILASDGALDSRTSNLNRDLERIEEDRQQLELRIQSYQERLVSQFSAADSLISQLNNTRDYVTQQLAALAPQNNKGN